ncbi:hypothetical protein ACFFLS_17530 [Flavobacterium procerum]|uniref:DUF3450 domain-containing protein n=1 Tax=Flavobacterium procerum TaxID=1455569 RepID=A0ABV6BUY7_9FLAO
MANENFNWKKLFINEEKSSNNESEIVRKSETSLNANNQFPEHTEERYNSNSTNPFFNEVLDVYEKGFASLNIAGFDFFEMYKSVLAVGSSNAQSYQMAFTMGKSINSDLTKEFLLDKAAFYTTEIEKVYEKYNAAGVSKKKELDNSITQEKYNLSKSVTELEAKIMELQKDLDSKKLELQKMDPDNEEQLLEIQLKIEANDLARQKILSSINTVVTGINQYL